MKRLFTSSLVLLLLVSLVDSKKALAEPPRLPQELRIVKVRLIEPRTTVYRPLTIRKGHIWRQGYWQWHKRKQTYVWVKPHSVKKRVGKTWINGHWSRVKGGWIYHAGFWA